MIRVLTLEGTWQTLGADLYPGAPPEGVAPTWGPHGPESLGFTLYRPPYRVHADLTPYTPVEWYPGSDASGSPLWSGYIQSAPPGGYGESTNVSCVGWHYYRDDVPGSALFVHDDITAWVDTRSLDGVINYYPYEFPPSTFVNVGDGVANFGWQKGARLQSFNVVGITLDLGPVARARHVSIDLVPSALTANFTVYVRGSPAPQGSEMRGSSFEFTSGDFIGDGTASLGPQVNPVEGTYTGTAAKPWRYVTILMMYTLAASDVAAPDGYSVTIKRARVFSDAAYSSAGGLSIFTADQGIKSIRNDLSPYLSADNSQITSVPFVITHAAWLTEDATAREQQEGLNDYHGYRLGVDAEMRMFFRPQPSLPRLQVDARAAGVEFRDTSTNDGSQVYNHVSVRGKSGSGVDLRVDRWLHDVAGVLSRPSVIQPTNPSFTVNTTGWTNMVRSTSNFNTTPASAIPTSFPAVGNTTGGTFLKGHFYRLSIWIRLVTNTSGPPTSNPFTFGSATDFAYEPFYYQNLGAAAFFEATVTWVPKADVAATSVFIGLQATTSGWANVDSLSITELGGNIVSKRYRKRSFTLNVAAATDGLALEALAKAWLLAHRTTPLKGSLTVTGGAVTDLVSNQPVRADHLGRYYGEMIRVLSVPDPDTGAVQSRDGIIASVQGVDPAQIAIDTERHSLEALMSRMGVVRG